MIAAPAFAASHVSIIIDAGKPGPVINKYDAHNTFRNPQVIKPAAFSARAVGGKLSVKVPAKAVIVLALEE